MKLCRIRTPQGVRPVAIHSAGTPRDLSGHIADFTPETTQPDALAALRDIKVGDLPALVGDYAPILSDARRLFCIGLNYSDHAHESNLPIPEFPILFMKVCPVSGSRCWPLVHDRFGALGHCR